MEPGEHLDLLQEALQAEEAAHRSLLAGDVEGARFGLQAAARRYRASWETAPPGSYGRLVGMLKAALIAGGGAEETAYVRQALGGGCDSPTSCYARAVALVAGQDGGSAREAIDGMRAGDERFGRAADALAALEAGDAQAYAQALEAIVADFAARTEHLTGVPVADTALMMEALAARRGLARHPESPLMPPAARELVTA